MLRQLRGEQPPEVTVRLSFAPGEAARVDFGAGPVLTHPDGKPRRTWAFVMTLAHSRHQYVEFVWDQSSATWLGCHRRAFEWFDGVPERVTIDNAKCAIVKARSRDPLVQRAYAECAEGYGFKIDACPPHDPQKKGDRRAVSTVPVGPLRCLPMISAPPVLCKRPSCRTRRGR
jgi:transposase